MEEYTYYIEIGGELHAYSYNDVVHDLNNKTLNPDKKIIAYNNISRQKLNIKAKDVLW